jgi:hypothetical protein
VVEKIEELRPHCPYGVAVGQLVQHQAEAEVGTGEVEAGEYHEELLRVGVQVLMVCVVVVAG